MRKQLLKTLALVSFGIGLSLTSNLANANDKPVLDILTYKSFDKYGPAKKLQELFEAKCNCSVKFHISGGQDTLITQLKLKKNLGVDLVLGIDTQDAVLHDVGQYFINPQIDTSKIVIPWHHQEQATNLIPYDWSPLTLLTKDKSIPDEISLQKFIDDKSTIIYPDPRTHALGKYLLLSLDYVYPNNNDFKRALVKLKDKTVTVGKGWSETWSAFMDGESQTYFGYASSELYYRINETTPEAKTQVRALVLSEGQFSTSEAVGIYKETTKPALAKQFVEFLLSPEAQTAAIELNSSFPVIKINHPVLNQLPKFKLIPNTYNWDKLKILISNWNNIAIN